MLTVVGFLVSFSVTVTEIFRQPAKVVDFWPLLSGHVLWSHCFGPGEIGVCNRGNVFLFLGGQNAESAREDGTVILEKCVCWLSSHLHSTTAWELALSQSTFRTRSNTGFIGSWFCEHVSPEHELFPSVLRLPLPELLVSLLRITVTLWGMLLFLT